MTTARELKMCDITERDNYIIGKALLYAIKYIDSRPVDWRECSDQEDMARILKERYPTIIEIEEMRRPLTSVLRNANDAA
jgi:hypothetical protein